MSKKCERCKKELAHNDFVCPHCGLIIGDPVSYATAVQKKAPKSKKIQLRRILGSLLAFVLLAALCLGVYFLYSHLSDGLSDQPTVPVSMSPTQVQTTAPLTVYTVQVRNTVRADLSGTSVHIYKGEEVLYHSQVGSDGTATFVLPEYDGYSVRLEDLPVQYQFHYEGVSFAFEDGQKSLSVELEEKPVPYTIRVTNCRDEPLAGVGIFFYSTGEEEQQQVTDESGTCTFMAHYGVGTCSAYIAFVPNGYHLMRTNKYFLFEQGKLESELKLMTYEEADVNPDDIFTVRVLDEYGQPVPFVSLYLNAKAPNFIGTIGHYGTTNMDGCYCFAGNLDYQYSVYISNNIDYHDKEFRFDEGSKELLIQLNLHTQPGDEYTYSVHFSDQFENPVPGVEIRVPDVNGGESKYYTSDENGDIQFLSPEADPTQVSFYINSLPDKYYTWELILPTQCTFSSNSRNLTVELVYVDQVDYTVTVVDEYGVPIEGAEVVMVGAIWYNNTTNKEGICVFHLTAADYYYVEVVSVPDAYAHLYFESKVIYHDQYNIVFEPSMQSAEYTVTFQDKQTGNRVAGVQIAVVSLQDGGGYRYYTSDQNGQIKFEITKYFDASVVFCVTACPDEYTTTLDSYTTYTFPAYSSSLTVDMEYDGKIAYKVCLVDEHGSPVAGAVVELQLDSGPQLICTDDQGCGTYRLQPNADYKIEQARLIDCPQQYENHIVVKITYSDDGWAYIAIEPSPLPGQGGSDE